MKRLSALILVLASLIFSLSSCSKAKKTEDAVANRKAGDTITLNVYNWGEYVADGYFDGEEEVSPFIEKYLKFDVNSEFEKYFNTVLSEKYGGIKVKINYTTYPTNEDMYSKLESGSGSYDVIFPSDYMVEKLRNENMLRPLDWSGLKSESNLKYLDPNYASQYFDPNNLYSVAYTYGRIGIIYNTAMGIDEADIAEQSWGILWNPKYSGKILQFNNPRDAFATAMYWKNLDVNSTDEAVWNEALELLKEQKQYLQGYVNDEIFDKMTCGSAAIAPYFVGDYVTMYADNENLAFYYPKEGTNVFIDAMCIPKSSKNPDIAMEYINFMLSPDAAMANALYLGYASPNTSVYNNSEYIDYMGEEIMTLLYGEKNDEGIYEGVKDSSAYSYDPYYHDFTPAVQRHVNILWEELKLHQGKPEIWVHLTSGVLVALVLIFAVYTVIIKKYRSRHYRLRDREIRKAKLAKSQK